MNAPAKTRPYWHVDLKWVCGIFLFLALAASSFLFVAATLLSPKVALPTATYIVAGQFSRDGLDDTTEIDKIKKQMAKSGKTEFRPLEGVNVVITEDDIANLSAREIRLKIFSKVVEPIYYRETADNLNKQAMKQYGALAALNEDTYRLLMTLFFWSLLPVAVFLAGIVYFSRRYGRLVSPAILLLFFGTLPSLLLFMIQATKSSDKNGFLGLPHDKVAEIAGMLTPYFYTMFLAGAALLLAIPAIKLTRKFTGQKKSNKK